MIQKYKCWLLYLLLAAGLIIIFGLCWRTRTGFRNPGAEKDIYSIDGVDNSNIKPPTNRAALLKATRSIPMDSGQCPSNKPLDVCKNYNACCELSGSGSTNCLCNNPVIKSCQDVYKDCLADKYLSEKSMDFISQENKNITCRKLLNNCCKITGNLTGTGIGGDMSRVTMSKAAPESNLLCEIQGSEKEALGLCKYTCDLNDKCSGIIYNKVTGICELYDMPLVDKAPAYRNKTDTDTIQFTKAMTSIGKEGFVGTAQDYCLSGGNADSCWNNNTVIRDCMTQRDKCLAGPIAGLSGPKQENHCRQMYGACCSILDGMDILDGRFKFLDATAGYPNQKNLLCGAGGTSLDDCKRNCLTNPDCNYIHSNMGDASGNNTAFCKLYKGVPLAGGIVPPTFGKVDASMDSKYIYKKIEVDPDEPVEETTTTEPTITKTDPDDASK